MTDRSSTMYQELHENPILFQQSEQVTSPRSSGDRIDELTYPAPHATSQIPSRRNIVLYSIIPHRSTSPPIHSTRRLSTIFRNHCSPYSPQPQTPLHTQPLRCPQIKADRPPTSRHPSPSQHESPSSTALNTSPPTTAPSINDSSFVTTVDEQTAVLKHHLEQQTLLISTLQTEMSAGFLHEDSSQQYELFRAGSL